MLREEKIFSGSEIRKGKHVFPSIIVSIISNWDGQKQIKTACLYFVVFGTKVQGEKAYDTIISHYPVVYKRAEKFAQDNSDSFKIVI